jgi:hypothetical protein
MALLIAAISNVSVKDGQENTIPNYKIDFSGNPSGIFNTPAIVRGLPKNGIGNERCLNLDVLLDENAEGIIFEKKGSVASNSNAVYYVNGELSATLGSPVCLNGKRNAVISFCADGNETAYYRVISVPRLKLTYDSVIINGGGESLIQVSGLEQESIQWKVLCGPQNIMKSTESQNKIMLDDKAITENQKILIEVSGLHTSTCGGSYSCRQLIRINAFEAIKLETTPNSSVCAPGGTVVMNAMVSGGKQPYSYVWKNQDGHFKSFTSSCLVDEPGNYTIEVSDATQRVLLSKSIPVNAAGILLPTVIQHKEVTQNTAQISWNHINNANKYKVRYRKSGITGVWNYASTDAATNELRLKKLNPDTEYEYQIMVCGKQNADTSGWSKSYRVTTLSECMPATQLSSKMTFNKLMCRWKTNPYNSKQVLLLRIAGSSVWSRKFKIGSEVSAVFLDFLKPETTYEWMIVSYCKNGEIPSSIHQFRYMGSANATVANN